MIADSCAPSRDELGDTSMILSDHRRPGCRLTMSRKRQDGKFSCALHQRTLVCPCWRRCRRMISRSEEHTSELQSRQYLVCRLLLEKKKQHLLLSLQVLRNSGESDAHSYRKRQVAL